VNPPKSANTPPFNPQLLFSLPTAGRLAGAVRSDTETLAAYSLGRLQPKAVISVQSIPELSAVLQAANESRASVLFWGGGTSMGLGSPPAGLNIVIDMKGLNQLVSHDVDNFTVTVQAGMTLARLQQIIGGNRQFLPLDPPAAEKATLGGIAAANVSGPWRLSFGAARDLVLGIKIVLADGRIVSFGGKTMKNVAGYDIGKLFIGSLGTLGAICELTFRLYSLPEESRSLLLAASTPGKAFALAQKAISWQPAAAQVLNPNAARLLAEEVNLPLEGNEWLAAADLIGDSAAVEKQAQEIEKASGSRVESLSGEERLRAWERIRSLMQPQQENALVCRANLPPSATEQWAGFSRQSAPSRLLLCPGTGRAWAQFAAQTEQEAVGIVNSVRAQAERLGGTLIIEAAPEEWKPALNIWGSLQHTYLPLLQTIKQSFDPNRILSPGRFVGGI
jgi:glycolate oxidase FAD binding subunit